VVELQLDLLLDGQDPVRQQAVQVERLALLARERGLLGQHPAAQQPLAALGDGRRPPGHDVLERLAERSHRRSARVA